MFFDQFTKLCEEQSTTPTKFVTEVLHLSSSKVTAWKNGSIPKYEILNLIADYFNVSIGTLFDGKSEPIISLTTNESEMLEVFQNFNDREQIKIIGRMEEWLEVKHQRESINQNQRIVGVQVARRTDGKFIKEPVTAEEMEKIKALPEDTDF